MILRWVIMSFFIEVGDFVFWVILSLGDIATLPIVCFFAAEHADIFSTFSLLVLMLPKKYFTFTVTILLLTMHSLPSEFHLL